MGQSFCLIVCYIMVRGGVAVRTPGPQSREPGFEWRLERRGLNRENPGSNGG